MNYCPNCGKRLSETENYCSNCGRSLKKKRGKKKLFIFFVIPFLVIAIVLIIFKFYLPSIAKHNLEVNTPRESSFSSFSDDSAAINKAAESVVKITGYNPQGIACVTGSGFALFEGGIIVSNYHVIEPGIVRLTAETEQGNSFECSGIIGLDKDKDIVILKTDNCAGLNPLEAGSSNNLQKGDKVVAIGSPLGLKNSVSTGVFSGYLLEPEGTVLQFTAAISSGSSGGALFDDAGRVIGITYASYSDGQSLNLAIPIENVEELFNRTNGKIKPMTLLEYYNEIYVPNHNRDVP